MKINKLLTENGLVNNIRIRQSNFHGMVFVQDGFNENGQRTISKCDVTGII